MPTALELKELQTPETPILLFECRMANGSVERWSTHTVSVTGHNYEARVLEHSSFDMKARSEEQV